VCGWQVKLCDPLVNTWTISEHFEMTKRYTNSRYLLFILILRQYEIHVLNAVLAIRFVNVRSVLLFDVKSFLSLMRTKMSLLNRNVARFNLLQFVIEHI